MRTAPSSPLAPCQRHPSARAGWHCAGCGAHLCPECVEARRASTVDLLVCRLCGDRAETLFIHRSQQTPLADRLGLAWRYLGHTRALALVVGMATVLTVFSIFMHVGFIGARLLPVLLGLGVFWGCFFAVMRSSARGEPEVPALEYTEFFDDWLLPAFRGLVATSVVWLPLGLYLVYGTGWDFHAYRERLLDDPMFYMTGRFHALPWELLLRSPVAWLLGLAALAYFPMALMLGAVGASTLDILNPLRGVFVLRRLGRDYVLTLATLLTLGLVFLGACWLGDWLRGVSLAGGLFFWLAELVEAPIPLLMAHVLGVLLYTRGDEFGQADARDYLVPVLPGAAPSTTLRVEGMGITEPSAEHTFPAAQTRVRELNEAVHSRDVPAALSLYAELAFLPRAQITPEVHLFVGQAAATYGDLPLAVRALESAADVAPENAIAPRALVMLARVLDERMRELTRAQDVYRYIVDRYPDTEASRFARAHLPPTS